MIFYHEGDDILARINRIPDTNKFNCIGQPNSRIWIEHVECDASYLDTLQPTSAALVKATQKTMFNTAFNESAQLIAAEFSRILHSWDNGARPINMQEVVARNKAYAESGDGDSCATHEMVDANQAMIDACEALGINLVFPCDIEGYPLDLQGAITAESDIQVDLTNAAWDLAKRLEFDVDRITAHK